MPQPKKKRSGVWTLVVQFRGQRRQLTLGKLPKSQVDHFSRNVAWLVEHVKHGGKSLPQTLQAWIADLHERHKIQLSEVGLFDYRASNMTIGQLMDLYVTDYDQRGDVTDSSKTKVRSAITNRLGKLRKISLDEIEPIRRSIRQNADPIWTDEAKKTLKTFNSWQRNHFAAATWSRDNKLFSSVGIWAVKQGYCDHNPFTPLPSASMVNSERNLYLPADMIRDVMESCISPDIRLTIALGRFAGLRTCSEVRTMKWSHIDTESKTLTIIDAKKKTPRVMPLFENALAELERQRAITGTTRYVASSGMRAASSSANYQQICDAIRRSGNQPWIRVRQNLRTSCENDLLELFDERLVTNWIGHTVNVSRNHYQKLRPSDYVTAVTKAAEKNLL